jgi:ribonuclease HI
MALDPDLGVALYTDGSSWSKDRSGGWAWLALDSLGNEASGSGSASGTTNNRMEMMGWIEGLTALHLAHGPCLVAVYSDSQYVGYGYQDPGRIRRANADLWVALDVAAKVHEHVEFVFVKGHRDDIFNHRVDEMAGLARRKGQVKEDG